MAGLEQLEIHSKSYLVRWVEVRSEHTISWSIQPHKKSINFGIFKHPGPGSAPTPKLPSSTFEPPPTPSTLISDATQDSLTAGNPSSAATEKLKSLGLRPISWYGTYEANRVSTGKYDVPKSEGGMYALVFDNTFAKQFSKSVTFVLLTYPTDCPPQTNHHMHHVQGPSAASTSSLGDTTSSRVRLVARDSADSVDQVHVSVLEEPNGINEARKQRQKSGHYSSGARFFTGILYKRRRKRHQGYARRFFTLDFSSSTLSYYHNRHTLALRGAVPLSLAAIGANVKTREISIDSGAEVWHLKALNQKDFDAWKNALELARTPYSPASPVSAINLDTRSQRFSTTRVNGEEEVEWERVEALVDRIHESRETARILAKDTDPKYLPLGVPKSAFDRKSTASSASESPPEKGLGQPFPNESDRRPFWKRKPSSEKSSLSITKRSVSAQPTSTPSKSLPSTPSAIAVPDNPSLPSHKEEGVHDHCTELLRNLESIVADFALLIEESKQRRIPVRPPPISATSRYSLDTIGSEEFFDAESGDNSQLLAIQHESDDERGKSDQGRSSDEDSASEVEDSASMDRITAPQSASTSAFPPKPHPLTPLPHPPVQRREMVPPSTVSPPSLIGFFRKNVGKDLSTIAMPVSANEPLSLLQRVSEQLEYSMLLDSAAMTKSSNSRLLQIAAFAVSSLSAPRVKERAIRKPFNPMLGETYELVRPDRGFRFMSEKVSHRPVRMACQAESEEWTLTQAPMPTQKFWGKSAELVTEGRVRVVLHSVGDRFSWTPATSFLRNMLAGEKYVEPVGTMTITNESNGEHAVVTFKSKGMFSGRSEDVVVQSFDSFGDELPLGLVGKWTSSLQITENGMPKHSEPPLWRTADLVSDVTKRYGFTKFAACLNEITHLESGRVAPTDSRLRPDQRMLEDGRFDQAEDVKFRLEEAQRQRRKAMEEAGEAWTPRWFGKVDGLDGGEEVWRLIDGEGGYWGRRERGAWAGGERVFDA